MMIDKRLIRTVRESKKYIAWNVIYQWISLVANITMMVSIADLLSRLFANTAAGSFLTCVVIALPLMPAIKTLLFGVGINSVMIFAGLGGDVLKKALLFLCPERKKIADQ